jgi:hypothetical protein
MGCFAAKEGGGGGGGGADGTSYDHLFKLVMVGEVSVGKSSLVCAHVLRVSLLGFAIYRRYLP